MSALVRTVLLAAAVALAACGAEVAPFTCDVAVQFEPLDAVSPSTITARATVDNATGVLTYDWTVRHDGAAVAITPRTPDSRDIDFPADRPGIYEVTLQVSGGTLACPTWQGDKNVRDPGTATGNLRLRFTPPAEVPAPIQERLISVPGGADYSVGDLAIDRGVATPIAVHDGGGAAVPAYVRLTSRATPDAVVEVVTTAGGGERATLAPGRYDALVIPLVPGVAPTQRSNWDPASGPLTVGAGTAISGRVLDAAGIAVVGARVAITAVDAAPSSVATTDATGGFTLAWEPSVGGELTVTPPAATGLARLTAPILDAARPWTVRYQPGHPVVDLGGVTARASGQPVANGHVWFALDVGVAATVSDGVTSRPAPGRHRDRIATDGSGRLAPYRATASAGRAYIVGATGPGAVALVDLATAPITLDAPTTVAVTGLAVDRDGAPLGGVAIVGEVEGDLAHLGAPRPSATTAADGRFTLTVAPGASYELALTDRLGRVALRRLVVAAAAGDLGTVSLPPAVRIRGRIHLLGDSTGLASAGVSALCDACSGIDRSRPVAETVTDVAGEYTVVIPDPSAPP